MIQKLIEDLADAFPESVKRLMDSLSFEELSYESGKTLDRWMRQNAKAVNNTLEPLRQLAIAPGSVESEPLRVGPGYRRHPDLVEMLSDEKVLLDAFAVLDEPLRKKVVMDMSAAAGDGSPTEYKSLSRDENLIVGAMRRMDKAEGQAMLAKVLEAALESVRRQRNNMF